MAVNVFISYPEEYVREADALLKVLKTRGIQGFSYKHERALPGTNFVQVLERNLKSANFIVLFWGAQSITKWIQAEVEYAHSLNKTIVPILIDNYTPLPPMLAHTQAIVSYEEPYTWALQVAFAIGALSEQQWQQQKQQMLEEERRKVQMLEEERRKEQMAAVIGAVGLGVVSLGGAAISAFNKSRKKRKMAKVEGAAEKVEVTVETPE